MRADEAKPSTKKRSRSTTAASRLTLRRVAIDTYRENVAYMHRDCPVYRAEGFQALSKVEIRANGQRILATLNVVDDPDIFGGGELGLSEDAFAQLGVADGHSVSVSQAEAPSSIPALHRKISGERLGRDDYRAIVRDILDSGRALSKMNAIFDAQGRKPFDHNAPVLGRLSFEFRAESAGVVTDIDNLHIARVAGLAGAPKVQGADLIASRCTDPLLIGPDAESAQWVATAAAAHGFEHAVCTKIRRGDRAVEITLPEVDVSGRAVVLLDDVASTGRTLAEAAVLLRAAGAASVDVAVTHALFAGDALQVIVDAGVGEVWSTDCIAHPSNAVSVAPLFATALNDMARSAPGWNSSEGCR
jgi:hypoxanthine-guanine phosphoribosyltransferase